MSEEMMEIYYKLLEDKRNKTNWQDIKSCLEFMRYQEALYKIMKD